jgi:hypothetical protein
MDTGSGFSQSDSVLSGEHAFKRWDWVRFKYTKPSRDARVESCRVHEESLSVEGSLPKSERLAF